MKWIFLALISQLPASAHEAGHGPLNSKVGPQGGPLTAIVEASAADLGRKAKAQGWMEHIHNNGYHLYPQGIDKASSGIESAKFIAVPQKPAKPLILERTFSPPTLSVKVPDEILQLNSLVSAEIIFVQEGKKYVSDLSLESLSP